MKKQILYEFTIDRNRKYTIYTDATIDLPKEDEGKPCWVNNNYPILIMEETENYCRYFCQKYFSPDKIEKENNSNWRWRRYNILWNNWRQIMKKKQAICKRCDYIWTPRKPDIKPKACPRCKRYDCNVKVSSVQSMSDLRQTKGHKQ